MVSPPPIRRDNATFDVASPSPPKPGARPRSGAMDLTSKVDLIAQEFESRTESSRHHSPSKLGPLYRRGSPTGNIARRWTPPDPINREKTPPQRVVRRASPVGPVATSPFVQNQSASKSSEPAAVPPLNLEPASKRRTSAPSAVKFELIRSKSAMPSPLSPKSPKEQGEELKRIHSEEKDKDKRRTLSPGLLLRSVSHMPTSPTSPTKVERAISPTALGRSVNNMPERKGGLTSPTKTDSLNSGLVRSPTSLERSLSRTKSQRHILSNKNEAGILDAPFINRKWHNALKDKLKENPTPFDIQYFDGLIKTAASSLVDQALNLKVDSQDLAISTKLNAIFDLVKTIDDVLFLKPLREKITEVHRILIEFLVDHKPTKEINEYNDLIADLVVANNLKEILAALRKNKHSNSLFQAISGNEKLDILAVLQRWEEEDYIRSQTEKLAIDLYRRVHGFLRDLGNKKFVFEEGLLETKPTKIISRDDICRTLVPGDADTAKIRVKGKCKDVPFNEALSAGNLRNQKDYRAIYLYHLFYMLNKVGFHPEITDVELEAQVTSFLVDYENRNPTDLNKYLPFETLLQLASMAGWGRNDTLFRSTFSKLSHLANMPTSPRHKVYLTRSVKEKANPETVIEVVNRDCYSVIRSKYYSIHNHYKDEAGILMPKDLLAEFVTEWTATVDLTTNVGKPVRTLKIKEFKFTDKASYEDKIDIIKNFMDPEVNPTS